MTVARWQVSSGGRPVGRFSEPELVHRVRQGVVDPYDLFWQPGMADAAPACALPPFAAAFQVPVAAVRDPWLRWVLPVGRPLQAVLAGYLGLFALLIFPAPLALIGGLFALADVRRRPTSLGRGRALFAVAAGGLGSLVLIALCLHRSLSA